MQLRVTPAQIIGKRKKTAYREWYDATPNNHMIPFEAFVKMAKEMEEIEKWRDPDPPIEPISEKVSVPLPAIIGPVTTGEATKIARMTRTLKEQL